MTSVVDTSFPARAPLTFQQQWFQSADRLSVGVFALHLRGALRVELLRISLNELSHRHGSLRTDILLVQGIAEQRVQPPGGVDLPIVSCDDASPPENRQKARRLIENFSREKLYRDTQRCFAVRLLRLAADEHVLVVTIHHVVSDGFSYLIFFRELWQLYSDLLEGRSPSARSSPAQYTAYATWQRNTESEWTDKHLNYWNDALAGAQPARLPVDTCPESFTRNEGFLKIQFEQSLSTAARSLARRTRVLSPALVILTAFVVVLSAWCGQQDFVVPFAVAGRHLPEHENMIGCFAYPLLLRIQLTRDERFIDLLTKVSKVFYNALKHQDFGRMASRAPNLLKSPSFNWLSMNPDELAGLPAPATRDRLSGEFSIGSLLAVRPHIPFDPITEREAGIAASIIFFDNQEGFSAMLSYHPRLAAMDQFAQYLRLWTQRFVQNPMERI